MNEIQQSGLMYATIMLVAGIGIPIMAALNAGLGIRLQSPGTASSILFLVGLFGSLTYLFMVENHCLVFQNLMFRFIFTLVGFLFFFMCSVSRG